MPCDKLSLELQSAFLIADFLLLNSSFLHLVQSVQVCKIITVLNYAVLYVCYLTCYLFVLVNNTVVKPGRCPTVKPSDTCPSVCVNDKNCSGKAKCCELGCGKTCREPAEEQLGM